MPEPGYSPRTEKPRPRDGKEHRSDCSHIVYDGSYVCLREYAVDSMVWDMVPGQPVEHREPGIHMVESVVVVSYLFVTADTKAGTAADTKAGWMSPVRPLGRSPQGVLVAFVSLRIPP